MDRFLIAFVLVLAVASLPLLAFEVGTLPGEAPAAGQDLAAPRLLTVAFERGTDIGPSHGGR
jgi:hypothetical protein